MGAPGGGRFPRGPATRGPRARRAPGTVVDRASGLHLSGTQGFTVRRIAGAAGISRSLGSRARTSWDDRHRRVARGTVQSSAADPGVAGILSARGGRTASGARRTQVAVVVVVARDAPRASRWRGPMGAEDRIAREPGLGGPAPRRPIRESRVRAGGRGTRPSRPAAADAARGRRRLASRSWHGLVRHARSVLVSFDIGAQRAAP